MGGVVGRFPRDVGAELQRDRTEPDVDDALPGVRVDGLGQLGARHARHDARDVVEQRPGLVERRRDLEAILEPHALRGDRARSNAVVRARLASTAPRWRR